MLLSLQSPFLLPLTSKSCVGARIASWHSSAPPVDLFSFRKGIFIISLLIYSFCLVILFNSWLYYVQQFLVFFTFVLICSFMQYFQHSINLITTFPMSLQLHFTILLHLKCARNMCARTIGWNILWRSFFKLDVCLQTSGVSKNQNFRLWPACIVQAKKDNFVLFESFLIPWGSLRFLQVSWGSLLFMKFCSLIQNFKTLSI